MLGHGTQVVNGQMITTPTAISYAPAIYGPVGGPGWQQAYSEIIPPSLGSPAVLAGTGMNATNPTMAAVGGGTSSLPNPTGMAFSPKMSPLPWAVLFLLLGLFGLRYIHFAT